MSPRSSDAAIIPRVFIRMRSMIRDESLTTACLPSIRALISLCLLVILGPIIVGWFPSLIGIIFFHALERLEGVLPQVLFVNDPVRANDKCLHSGYPIFC